LKQQEQNLREKESNKYFRCKLTTPALYRQITEAIAPYLLEDKLIMLAHRWSTQLNEAMNNSVQAYAPKTKNFSGTISLRTRVGIAAGILALGYEAFWTLVFRELKVEMDTDFRSTLQARDKKKAGKRASQKSIKGKVRRRQTFMSKFHEAHKEQMNDAKTGKTYGAGVAVKAAKKTAKDKHTAAERNPEGTPKDQMCCAYYHPLYCTSLGHTTASSKECAMKYVSADQRKVILGILKQMQIDEELALQEDGKFTNIRILLVLLLLSHNILSFVVELNLYYFVSDIQTVNDEINIYSLRSTYNPKSKSHKK